MSEKTVKGYKVFNPDWTCRGFQYKVGESYEMDKEPIACERGFHFCERLEDCFNYYDFEHMEKQQEKTIRAVRIRLKLKKKWNGTKYLISSISENPVQE